MHNSSPRPPRRRRALRIFGRLIMIVFGLLGLGLLGGYLYIRDSLPLREGTLEVSGLIAPVEIMRDAYGVPHIYAEDEFDALFGLGYVHAQDRLWQMEFQRRIARGTLSEVLGEPGLETDRFLRTLGIYRAAESAYAGLDVESQRWINAYVAGINAFLADNSGSSLPPEFLLVGVTPEPWVGADVLGWAKMMSWDLSGNYSYELLRANLIEDLGIEKASELLPTYPGDAPTITSQRQSFERMLAAAYEIEDFLGMGGGIVDGVGSNNWVLAPSRTTTGAPLLANDPHLSLRTPAIWYLATLHGGRLQVAGGTIPGLPGVLSGHNERIAWGVTTMGPDVQDLYMERLDQTGTMVEYNGVWESLEIISDTIVVKDKGALPLQIRVSRHGPLISDAINANSPDEEPLDALAFRWTSLEPTDTTMQAYREINLAGSWDEFTTALRSYIAPSQNFVYADVDGNIGYYAPAQIPVRAAGNGSLPSEGWNESAEWVGYIPFEELPQAFNPAAGFIVTANNRAVPADYPYFLTNDWATPFRAKRITSLIEAEPQHSLESLARMQGDQYSLYAENVLPRLLEQTTAANDQQQAALDMLRQWNYAADRDSAAATIFAAWNYYLLPALIGDELGADLIEKYGGRRSYVDSFVWGLVNDPASAWCDNIQSAESETCGAIFQRALDVALQDLTQRFDGAAIAEWRWGNVHLAFFPHEPLDKVQFLRGFFSHAIANGGDGSSINVAPVDAEQPFDQTHGPALRSLLDPSDWDRSLVMISPGQSGHLLSDHYADLLPLWQAVEYMPLHFSRAAVEQAAVTTLRLEPGAGSDQ